MKRGMSPEKLHEIAQTILIRRGYDILEKDYQRGGAHIDFIVHDPEEDDIVFIDLNLGGTEAHSFAPEDLSQKTRDRFEKVMIAYVSENDVMYYGVRYDCLSMYGCNSETACIRYHIDALRKAA